MQIPQQPPRRGADTLLPMINVVFLLLIFFLMSAQINSPEPLVVEPPVAKEAQQAEGVFTVFIDADARLGFLDALDDDAIVALSASRDIYCGENDCTARPAVVFVRADGALPASVLAKTVRQLKQADFTDLMLVTSLQGAEQ
ncbi:biopolymer transporter ExbD [Falsirhodobacter sp. alg1]|uniref:ExbD/TolR family protein n=1 Tax=Falsirhodobacter sp. alg1 TaxID=1472418 RepID=UPI0005EE6CDF|nr:biopolymer transporter ExbD [Falsirhodobacter sp. alg1]